MAISHAITVAASISRLGRETKNALDPDELSTLTRRQLKSAFRILKDCQQGESEVRAFGYGVLATFADLLATPTTAAEELARTALYCTRLEASGLDPKSDRVGHRLRRSVRLCLSCQWSFRHAGTAGTETVAGGAWLAQKDFAAAEAPEEALKVLRVNLRGRCLSAITCNLIGSFCALCERMGCHCNS